MFYHLKEKYRSQKYSQQTETEHYTKCYQQEAKEPRKKYGHHMAKKHLEQYD